MTEMKGLPPELVKKLLSKPPDPPKRKGKKRGIDTSVRDLNTWFKLRHKFIQEIPGLPEISMAKCSNQSCLSGDKPKGAVAEVNGVDMCRLCFLDGYMLIPAEQMSMTDG